VPGVSLGLTIAEKNGLPGELVGRARDHLREISGAAPDSK
jgi:DNA mismatch repair protein MutS2